MGESKRGGGGVTAGGTRRKNREVCSFPLPLVPCVHVVIKLYPWLVQILFPFFQEILQFNDGFEDCVDFLLH